MKVDEVAQYLFVSRAHVLRLVRRGDLLGTVGGDGELVVDEKTACLYRAMQEAAANEFFRAQREEDDPPGL
ncbi:MerR family transcriptional regulator [Paraburkholderia dilworthii]|uniref:helix-turn-helix domain-containing protein n=1 Tax=Paraburkholderia dilworthii TaxID=948106 RepID=UPI0003FC12B2|nr:helix-turn-helix domain-containing protein [Paraburkholderia dilworthii]